LEKKGKGKNSCVYEAKNKLDNKIYAVKIQSYVIENLLSLHP
jgi:hypothetical protein